jgi:nitrite reductase/ring-hydroxylating ferredoxin subunit/uncharacterized membrane protein
MLVAFPIGLWVTSFIFDLIARASHSPSLWAAAYYLIIAGIIGAILAAIAGAIDLFGVVPPQSSAKRRGYLHASLNVIALVLFIIVAFHRGRPVTMPDGWSLLLSLIALIILGFSGWLGGTLVYRNQIGVDHRYAHSTTWTERRLGDWSEALCDADELKPGQLMLVHIGDQRIAVGRCGEGLVAFSDHCTHRGGSLSDGALVGCTVQCPWHGSQFDVHTGQVVAGPAPQPIQTYALEVRAGQVYLIQPAQQRWAA